MTQSACHFGAYSTATSSPGMKASTQTDPNGGTASVGNARYAPRSASLTARRAGRSASRSVQS